MDIKLFKLLQLLIKYGVAIGALLMTIHCGCLYFGRDYFLPEWICGFSVIGYILLMVASFCLRLCWTFRSLLTYDFAVTQCIMFQEKFNIFGEYLQSARLFMFVMGCFLLSYVALNFKQYCRV